jgi:hypothetical protein
LREGLFDIGLEHGVGLGEIVVGLDQHRQARNAGNRDVTGIEKVVADLHDIFAHGLGDVAGVDLQRAGEVKPDFQFAVRRLLDLLGK